MTMKNIFEGLTEQEALDQIEGYLSDKAHDHKVAYIIYTKEFLEQIHGMELTDDDMDECQAQLEDFSPVEYL